MTWPLFADLGRHADWIPVNVIGHNNDLDAGVTEDIWHGGNSIPWLTAAATLRVRAGGNAADTAAGAGARTVTVWGLDATLAPISETLTLAGASASAATTLEFFRVNASMVATSGTYSGANTGQILIETSGGVLVDLIDAGEGRAESGRYTVPLNCTGYLRGGYATVSASGGKTASLDLYTRADALTVAAPFAPPILGGHLADLAGLAVIPFHTLQGLEAGTDIWMTGTAVVTNTAVGVNLDLMLRVGD